MPSREVPEYLLSRNQISSEENIALFEAALAGDYNRVKTLLEQGAKPNYFYRPEDQKSSLHVAAENGYSDIVQLLLQNGAVVNAVTGTDHSTPLICAANRGSVEVLQLLIAGGADVQAENSYGNTALNEAAHGEFLGKVECLLRAGASGRVHNHRGSTPLHSLCYSEEQRDGGVDIVYALLDAGADIDAEDKHRMTPFLVCCTTGRVDLADALVRRGANIHQKNEHGQSAKDVAAFYRQSSMLDYLISLNESPAQAKGYK